MSPLGGTIVLSITETGFIASAFAASSLQRRERGFHRLVAAALQPRPHVGQTFGVDQQQGRRRRRGLGRAAGENQESDDGDLASQMCHVSASTKDCRRFRSSTVTSVRLADIILYSAAVCTKCCLTHPAVRARYDENPSFVGRGAPCPRRLLATALGVLVVCASTLVAQTPSGEISGAVTDASGAAMPGVTITLTNQATNAAREVQTNDARLYVMPAIQPGLYTLKATLSGFRTHERRDIEVQVGSAHRIAVTMEVGALAEIVRSPAARRCWRPRTSRSAR